MTKWGYVFYWIFVVVSLVSVFLFERQVLAVELVVSILFTISSLYRGWKSERSMKAQATNSKRSSETIKQEEKNNVEITLCERKVWLKKRQQIMDEEERTLRQSTAYKRFVGFLQRPTGMSLTDKDWEELIRVLEHVIPNFQSIRLETEQMSQDEYRLCILIRYGFKPSEIASVMGKTNTFITKTRQTLLDKIFHVSGAASELDIRLLDIF